LLHLVNLLENIEILFQFLDRPRVHGDEWLRKKDCMDILREAGIWPPEIYGIGFKSANCVGCIKSTSPSYWNLVRREFPDTFADRAEQSRRIGAKLVQVKGERVFLDKLPANASGQMDLDFDCGVFCEEKPIMEAAQ